MNNYQIVNLFMNICFKQVSECAVCQAAGHIIKQEVEYTPIKVGIVDT